MLIDSAVGNNARQKFSYIMRACVLGHSSGATSCREFSGGGTGYGCGTCGGRGRGSMGRQGRSISGRSISRPRLMSGSPTSGRDAGGHGNGGH